MTNQRNPSGRNTVAVNRGPVGKLENDLKRVKGLARAMRMRYTKEQFDLTNRLREICKLLMTLNDSPSQEIDRFNSLDKHITQLEQYSNAFIDCDGNLSSKISWEEFGKTTEYLNIRNSQHELKRSFNNFDVNGDGTIAEKEFFQCLLPDVNVSDLYPLAQIANIRKNLSGIRNNMDRKNRALQRVSDDYDEAKRQIEILRNQLTESRMHRPEEPRYDSEPKEDQSLLQEYLQKLEERERQNADLADQLREAKKEIKRLQKFGTISRNTVNNMEMTTSKKLLEVTKMCMIASEASPKEFDEHNQDTKQVDLVFQLRQAFLEFDGNHSAEMSFDEFGAAFKKLRLYTSERDLKGTFLKFDRDGSGYISEDEFMISVLGDTFDEVGVSHYLNNLAEWIRRLATSIADDRSALTTVTQERNQLRNAKKDLEENVSELQESNRKLQRELSDLEDELILLRKQLKHAEEENQATINRLELALKEAKETILELTERIRVLDRENELLTREIERLNLQHEENNRLLTKKFTAENQKLKDEIIITKEEYEKLQEEIARLRKFAKQLRAEKGGSDSHLSQLLRDAMRKVLVAEDASKNDLEDYDVESERTILMYQLSQAFLELDRNHTQEMTFQDFNAAWKWLGYKSTDPKNLKTIFDKIDRKERGYIEEEEFIHYLMGASPEGDGLNLRGQTEKACLIMQKILEELAKGEEENLILRQQIDDLTRRIAELKDNESNSTRLLNDLESKLLSLERKYADLKQQNDELRLELKARDTEYDELERRFQELEREYQRILKMHQTFKNKTLKNRLNQVVQTLTHDISESIRHLNNMMDKETKAHHHSVDDEQIYKQLYQAFAHFDKNKDNRLDFQEFKDAWRYIGLQTPEDELREIFDQFDSNHDGYISDAEFVDAIMEERLLELNMFLLFMKLARTREDLDKFISGRKNELQKVTKDYTNVSDKFEVDRISNARRRNNDFNWETRVWETCKDLNRLAKDLQLDVDPISPTIEERRQQYLQLRKAFSKYDVEHNGCLTFEQFDKAWIELGLPGSEVQRKRQFTFVDEDASGYLSFREFISGCVGPEKGAELGPLTEAGILYDYLKVLLQQHHLNKGELEEYMKQLRELEKLRELLRVKQDQMNLTAKELEKLKARNLKLCELVEQLKMRIRDEADRYVRQLAHEKQMYQKQINEQEKRLRESNFVCERLEDDNILLTRQLEHVEDNLSNLTAPYEEEKRKVLVTISDLKNKVANLEREKESLNLILQTLSTQIEGDLERTQSKI